MSEDYTLDGRCTEFSKISRQGSKHEDRGHTRTAVFQGLKTLLGRARKVFGDFTCHHLLVPVTGGAITLGVLTFTTNLQLQPANNVLVDRVLFEESLKLFGRHKRGGNRLDGHILGAALGSRILGIGQNTEHGFDAFVDAALFDRHDSVRKFHTFTVNRIHIVFQKPRRGLVGFVALVFAQVALRKHDRGLFTRGLAKAGLVDLLEGGDGFGTLPVLD